MAATQKPKLIFMGTSHFAAAILQQLLDWDKELIGAVYAQPDKKAGRGLKLQAPPVKKLALEHDLPTFQPPNFKDPDKIAELKELNPDYLVVAAYGLILPQSVLDVPKMGVFNVHASLLPAYRGAAPIQRAIMEQPWKDAVTGVSIMEVVRELDAGPVYAARELPIAGRTAGELSEALAQDGGTLLIETLEKAFSGGLRSEPQDSSRASYAPKLTKADGIIDWSRSRAEVDALIRGVTPWPGAQTELLLEDRKNALPVIIARGEPGEAGAVEPGTIRKQKNELQIACGDGWYNVRLIRPQGKKEMPAAAFINGLRKSQSGVCGRAMSK